MKPLVAFIGVLAAALAVASPAAADLGFEPGSFSARLHDAAGTEVTQAGAHPDATVEFTLRSTLDANGQRVPDGSVKDVAVELPAGLVGNPQATPRCLHAVFVARRCDRGALVGTETIVTGAIPGVPVNETTVPVWNLVPPDGVVARFGFQVASVIVTIDMRVRSDGDYNLVADIGKLSSLLQIYGSKLTLWGVPADHNGDGPVAFTDEYFDGTYGAPGTEPRRAFLTAPTKCGPPLTTTISATSWQQPDRVVTDAYTPAEGITGCEALSFGSALDLRPESSRAGVPAPYAVTLSVPQSDDPDALATPTVKDVAVTLPEGVAVSPSSAGGLVGCSDAQAALRSLQQPACPAASKIGTVEIETPLLAQPLTGAIFLGQPKSMEARSGEMLRTLLIASGEGVTVKLEGKITPDPLTGRLSAVFLDNPQLPFSLLTLRFQGGPRAPLTNPQRCGTHTTSATIASWGGQSVGSDSSFGIAQSADGSACAPLGFAPLFGAGMANAAAAGSSAFSLSFGRDDGQQDLGDLTVELPPGLTGVIASADLCQEAAAAAGGCSERSRIGSAAVAAGPGASPFQLPGPVYVTGPYKGAPFGLSIVVRAMAGPFDLGTVVVRAAIELDRRTAALRIVSDPLPTILQGIPLRIRAVNVAIDKPGFMLNPTSCSEKRIGATLRSAAGAVASVAARFQVGGCAALPYRPRLGLQIGARGRTKRGITTPLNATLRMLAGDANNRVVAVNLPKTLNARLKVIQDACTLAQFEAGTCAKQVGTAVAVTPLLRDPLRGPVYFVRNPARRIPDMMVALRGQVAIDLVGKVTIARDLTLRTEFDTIPDVPISLFRLSLVAGRRGAVGTTADLCQRATRSRLDANLLVRAQSGRARQVRQRISVVGCGGRAAATR
jgi:hypothetical protein